MHLRGEGSALRDGLTACSVGPRGGTYCVSRVAAAYGVLSRMLMLALTLAHALTLMLRRWWWRRRRRRRRRRADAVGGGVRSSFVVRAWLVEAEYVRGR